MTETIGAAARVVAAPGTEILAVCPRAGVPSIEGHFDREPSRRSACWTDQGRTRAGVDGHVIACFGRPGAAGGAEPAQGPVDRYRGGGNAYGDDGRHPFLHWRPTLPRTLIIARHLLHQYGFHQHCAALHAIDFRRCWRWKTSGLAQEKVRERCIRALKEDGSGAIVLGCGGMATLAQELTRELRVPVIDAASARGGEDGGVAGRAGPGDQQAWGLSVPEKKSVKRTVSVVKSILKGQEMGENQEHYPRDLRGYAEAAARRAGRAGRGSRCSLSSTMRKARRITSCMAMRVRNSSCPILSAPPATRRAICRWIHSGEYGSRAGFWRIHRELQPARAAVDGLRRGDGRWRGIRRLWRRSRLRITMVGQPRLALDPLSAHGYCRGARASAKAVQVLDRPVRQTAHRLVYRPRQP